MEQQRTHRGRNLVITVMLGIALAIGLMGLLVANGDGIRDYRDQVNSGAAS